MDFEIEEYIPGGGEMGTTSCEEEGVSGRGISARGLRGSVPRVIKLS